MKRHVNFFRIKLILIIAVIVFPIVFFVTLVSMLSPDRGVVFPLMTYENAPENTAYLDILIKLPEDSEKYVDFAEWEEPPKKLVGYKTFTEPVPDRHDGFGEPTPRTRTYTKPVYEELSITPDSEIAKLNADGYVSLSVHYAGSKGFLDTRLRLDYGYHNDISEIKKRYGKFKAAYVDENGNVLGITKTARMRYDLKKPSSITASGDELIFTEWAPSPLQIILLYVSLFGEPAAIIALIVCNVLDKRKIKQPSSDEKV